MPLRKCLLFCIIILVLRPVQAGSFDSRIAAMSLEQKVAQMFVVSIYGTTLNSPARDLLRQWQPGAVVLLPGNLENPPQITRLTNDIQQTLLDSGGVPAFIAVDQEGGIIAHLKEGFTEWPAPTLLTATQDTTLAHQFGEALATEMRAVGINTDFAPVADLLINRDNPIIGRRAFGTYPEQVAPIVAAVIEGLQANRVMATAKHFPGHGATDSDSHVTLPVLSYSQQELASRELIPFEAAIQANSGAVMVAHIAFPALEADPTLPASLSPDIVTGLLRVQMAYNGLIITDALDMDAVDSTFSPEAAAVQAVIAGQDLIIIGAHSGPQQQTAAMQAVVDAVRRGAISEARIDESVQRILEAKERFDILNWEPLDPDSALTRIGADSHMELVKELFAAGITVAYGQELLPLPDNTAFIYPATRVSLRTACQKDSWHVIGVSDNPTEQEIAWARVAAQSAEVTVVFTENVAGNPQQQALVSALPAGRTLLIALWSPYDALVLPETQGYMVTYSPLLQSHEAICAILKGEATAHGTLSVALD